METARWLRVANPLSFMAMSAPGYPGSVAPERVYDLDSLGVRLRLSEWGDPAAPPVLLLHGMFDHGLGFDTLAPLLAARFRVVALDSRGHGDSAWVDIYPWVADILDVVRAMHWLERPVRLIGHSRGGGLAFDAALAAPDRVLQLASIDGFGPPPEGFDVPIVPRDRRPAPERFAAWLDSRRRSTATRTRWYRSLDDLVARRQEQNPRLSTEWLRHFVFHAARESGDGWTWKADLRAARGFGPFKPDWIGHDWPELKAPVLAMVGSEPDTWGPLPEWILGPRLERIRRLERVTIPGAGHFVHMERPRECAAALLDWLEP